ncbi:unnamed protein product [Cyclocybe aegerita]|uniref:Acyl-CoA oxidase/dehydrogenase middle domain-containing protein n=1 Tax=Cyclocybe aegerita TaxID=1973307 RepID=A0A8S0X4R9_CYCAE|nr:unnamed protein product [Cyclocybe aegerita]
MVAQNQSLAVTNRLHLIGGRSVLLEEGVAGNDATNAYFSLHRKEVVQNPQYQRLQIGVLEGGVEHLGLNDNGLLSKLPYAEPSWLVNGFHSPYFTDNHRTFQVTVRKFVDEVCPDAQLREDGKRPSQHVIDEMARLNIIVMRLGSGKHLKGRELMSGIVKPEEFDQFHELILWQELGRIHARGYSDGLGRGSCIGLPPLINFGSKFLSVTIVQEKFICLAVTEAFAGSDVAGIKCSATRAEGGWVESEFAGFKWITNGTWADYFTVAYHAEGDYMVLVVPRQEGLTTKPIHTSYSITAGTAFVTFDNVSVRNEFVVTEKNGRQLVFSNFNHER